MTRAYVALWPLVAAAALVLLAVFWPAIAQAMGWALHALTLQLGPDVIGSEGPPSGQGVVRDTIAEAMGVAPEEIRRPEALLALGLYPDRLAAGLAGGFVRLHHAAARRRRSTPAAWLAGLVAGALTANYVGLILTALWPALDGAGVILVGAFMLGYGGEPLLDRLVEAVARRSGAPPFAVEEGPATPGIAVLGPQNGPKPPSGEDAP